MPKCPECGEEIDELITYRREFSEYRIWFEEGEEYPEWERIDVVGEGEDDEEYECPKCGATLFKSYRAAVAFLKGETP